MAATPTVVDRGAAGDLFFRIVDVLLDGSYPNPGPTGGYALTPQQLGFGSNGTIFAVFCTMSKAASGFLIGWDYTNGKLQVFDGSGAANALMHEVANATALSAIVARLLVFGKGQG